MSGPIDYTFSATDPMNDVMEGMAMRDAVDQRQANKVAAEQEALRKQQMQSDINSILDKEAPSAADYAKLTLKYPEASKQFSDTWKLLAPEAQSNQISQVSNVYAALSNGNSKVASELLEKQALAAENSGDTVAAKAARDMQKLVEQDPQVARGAAGMRLASMMGADKFADTYTGLESSRRKTDMEGVELTKAQSEANRAATLAQFEESQQVADLRKKGWDIEKIKNDIQVSRDNVKIAALVAKQGKESDQLKKDELQLKIDEAKRKRDEAIADRSAEGIAIRDNADNTLATLDAILNTPISVVDNVVGPGDQWTPTIRQDSADFEELLATATNQLFLQQAGKIKGSLSEAEGTKLEKAIKSISPRNSAKKLMENVKEIQRLTLKARQVAVDKYGIPDTIPDTPAVETDADILDKLYKDLVGGQ